MYLYVNGKVECVSKNLLFLCKLLIFFLLWEIFRITAYKKSIAAYIFIILFIKHVYLNLIFFTILLDFSVKIKTYYVSRTTLNSKILCDILFLSKWQCIIKLMKKAVEKYLLYWKWLHLILQEEEICQKLPQ